ncbi:hypothetical protein ACLM5H_12765 [Fredinandcohnia humi]
MYEDYNPLSLVKKVDKDYVVQSQLEFEALMLHKEIHCFVNAVRIGEGLTKNRFTCERRTKFGHLNKYLLQLI